MFANLFMAWGLAAVALPILIHLLNRQRYRTVEWAAMEFLLKAIKKNARKLQLRDIILMLIRTAAVLFFVLALMRPVVCSYSTGGLFGRDTVRITVVDISGSMDVNDGGKTVLQSTIEAVRESARETALKLDARARNVLLTAPSDTSVELPDGASDPQMFDGHLAALKQSGGSADFPRTMDRVKELINGRFKTASVELYVFSDMQKSAWNLENHELADTMRQISSRGHVYLIDVSRPAPRNLTIEEFKSPDDTVLVGHEIPFLASIRNTGSLQADTTAELLVDGVVKYQQVVSVQPSAVEQLTFTVRPDTRGEHRVSLRLSQDNLNIDNEAFRILLAEDKMRVLIVDGNARDIGADSAGLFLKKVYSTSDLDMSAVEAGTPGGAAGANAKNAKTTNQGVAISRISAEEWPEQNLADAQLICLCGVPSIPTGMGNKLKRFVARGGGLMIFPSTAIDVDNYHRELGIAPPQANGKAATAVSAPDTAAEGGEENISLLPAKWGAWWGEIPDPEAPAPAQVRTISSKDVSHPIMLPFAESGDYQQLLANVKIYRGLQMDLVAANNSDVGIVARLDNGQVLAAVRSVGSGQVLMWSSSCDTQMSNLPWFGAYFIIMERSAEYLTIGSHPPLNLYAGDDLIHPVADLEAGSYYQLTDPLGRKETMPPPYRRGARWVVSPPDAPLYPGFLAIQKGAAVSAEETTAAPAPGQTDYSVSPRKDEFALSFLSENALKASLPGVDFTYLKGSRKLADALITGAQGIELWWFFILLVFALLVLESYLVILWKPGGSKDELAAAPKSAFGFIKSGFGLAGKTPQTIVPTASSSPPTSGTPAP